MVRKFKYYISFLFFLGYTLPLYLHAQPTHVRNSAEILQHMKKLQVLGSVLYVAAHPDDENTRLLAYLTQEKQYRSAYLSITRGDGGQNLIGDEQGIELGLIRTQELLSARRIDGAEQFFTRAYDFGYSKSTEEALSTWNKDKVLSDVVWIIRKYQPDVIITRFPEDNRAGHGHHSASAVLAREAFIAAADPKMFPEQFTHGVKPWQAKRILWNTFNFGSVNTQRDDQFKLDVGAYNPYLGKSYGELAAESRSQHKSQGFGVPSGRGSAMEYLQPVLGDKPVNDLMDGVKTDWSRIPGTEKIITAINEMISRYKADDPRASVPALLQIYDKVNVLPDSYWKQQKLTELKDLLEACTGMYLEATTTQPYAVQGDTLRINYSVIDRNGSGTKWLSVSTNGFDSTMNTLLTGNRTVSIQKTIKVPDDKALSQPYWLQEPMEKGSYNVNDQELIGQPDNSPSYVAIFTLDFQGRTMVFERPVMYRYTDPVKGELYQPLTVMPSHTLNTSPAVMVFNKNGKKQSDVFVEVTSLRSYPQIPVVFGLRSDNQFVSKKEDLRPLQRGQSEGFQFPFAATSMNGSEKEILKVDMQSDQLDKNAYLAVSEIKYDHIPTIRYFYQDAVKMLNIDLKTAGKNIGYIKGAGDKVPDALIQMGYEVTFLEEKDMIPQNLKQYDAIVTGVRAYNVNEWISNAWESLMSYVVEGGNLVVQYNTSNQFGPMKARMAPYSFNISRGRITDEESEVTFLKPEDPVLNYPNKISAVDFKGWIQERGVYFADQLAPEYRPVLSMKDPGESELNGSLIVADYGKGRFVYTGLAFFRQLPAGVPGAYRLFANLLAKPVSK